MDKGLQAKDNEIKEEWLSHTWPGEPRCVQEFNEETEENAEGQKLFSIFDLRIVILTGNYCFTAVVLEAAKGLSKSDLEILLRNCRENEVPEENALIDG